MTLPQNLLQKSRQFFKSLFPAESAAQSSLSQVTDLPDWQQLMVQRGAYARHFQPEPLADSSGLLGREDELARLEELLERWESGRACSLAVIGPEGSGKTSLLNSFAESVRRRSPVLVAQLPQRVACVDELLRVFADIFGAETPFQSVQELIRFILSRPRQVFILEHGHNLTLRLVGCREALDAFCYLLIETRQHWMWVVSFRKFSWERLVMTARIQEFFTHQMTTLYQDVDQLRAILEGRHAQTARPLEFIAANGKDSSQEGLAKAFYADLFAATGGNIIAAFYYWLLCLEESSSAETVRIKPLGAIGADYLRSLDRGYHFSLAEVIWHGGLTCSEHQQIFLLSEPASRLQLTYLEELSLLVTDGTEASGDPLLYRLNPVYYKQVVALLESLHLLY